MPKSVKNDGELYLYLFSVDNGEEEFLSLFWRESDVPAIAAEKLMEAGIELTDEEVQKVSGMSVKQILRFANAIEGIWVDIFPFQPEGDVDEKLIGQIRGSSAPALSLVKGGSK